MRPTPRDIAIAALLGLSALLACQGSNPAGETLSLRLIAEDPGEVYDARQVGRAATAFAWTFKRESDLAGWRAEYLDLRQAWRGDGIQVRFERPDPARRPQLVRALDLDASALDAIEVEVSGARRDFRNRGRLQLCWSGPGQGFTEERSVAIDAVQEMGAYAATYSFPLAGHPLWAGRIASLRLDPTSAVDDTVQVRAIRAIKYKAAPERLAAALARAWKVDLGDDLRPARLAPPGHPLEWTVEVPAASHLRFSYGVSAGAGGPLRFTVSLAGTATARIPLFEDTVEPSPREPGAWREASVDLSRFAGQRLALVFETASVGGFDPWRAVAAWGSPEVWQRDSRPLPPNVVLVSLDTLRADRLSLYGNPRPTSPLIDDWARRRGVVFENTVAPSPWTLPSHASLFTGLDALRHGVNHGYPVPRSLTVMADLFRRAGYATLGVTGGGYMGAEYGFDRGFDSYYGHRQRDDDREMEKGIDRSIRWLQRRRGQPFFLFFHTYAIHAPYHARQPYFARLEPGRSGRESPYAPRRIDPTGRDGFMMRQRLLKLEPGTPGAEEPDLAVVSALYDSNVAYADAQLGRLLRELASLDLERRTVVVVTSDHGEALGERGLAGHAYLYDFNLLVPLVVAVPDGRGAGRRVPAQVRSVDVLPTLLELAGLPSLPGIDGATLVPLLEGKTEAHPREAWSYAGSTNFGISLRGPDRVKYIYNDTAWGPACGKEELYRLAGDPGEEHDLAATTAREDAARWRERVQHALGSRSSGLLVQLSNAGAEGFSGTLEAPFLHQVRTKSPGPECGQAAWNPARGGIDFAVPPGQSYRLLLEGIGPGELTVNLTLHGAPLRATLHPRELVRPWQAAFRGSTWSAAEGTGAAPATGVRIQWVGEARVEEAQPSESDQALRERLKALGYVQ